MNKAQSASFELLKWVRETCRIHGLTYYLSGGTLLGAARSGGFIPWDDDIDVALPREHYDALVKIVGETPPEGIIAEHYSWDATTVRPYLCLRSTEASLVNRMYDPPQIQAAWLDIFPLDRAPRTPLQRVHAQFRLGISRLRVVISKLDSVANARMDRPLHESLALSLLRKLRFTTRSTFAEACRRQDATLRTAAYGCTGWVFNYLGRYRFASVMNFQEFYGEGTTLLFEGLEFRAPESYERYLEQIYGNWRVPSPEGERNLHQTELADSPRGRDEMSVD